MHPEVLSRIETAARALSRRLPTEVPLERPLLPQLRLERNPLSPEGGFTEPSFSSRGGHARDVELRHSRLKCFPENTGGQDRKRAEWKQNVEIKGAFPLYGVP